MHHREETKFFGHGHSVVLLAAVVLLVAGGVLVAVIVGRDQENKDYPTSSPTGYPTETPSLPPSMTNENYLLAMLPDYTKAAIEEGHPDSPQLKAFEWMVEDPSFQNQRYPDFRILQRYGLAAFYYATGGTEWVSNRTWLSYDHHECEWDFSEPPCDETNETVVVLTLQANVSTATVQWHGIEDLADTACSFNTNPEPPRDFASRDLFIVVLTAICVEVASSVGRVHSDTNRSDALLGGVRSVK